MFHSFTGGLRVGMGDQTAILTPAGFQVPVAQNNHHAKQYLLG